MTDKYCVIGNPIAHSKSPDIHAAFARATGQDIAYERCLAPLDGFADTVRALIAQGYRGANVTVPFKLEAASARHPPGTARAPGRRRQHAALRGRRDRRRQHRRPRPGGRHRPQCRRAAGRQARAAAGRGRRGARRDPADPAAWPQAIVIANRTRATADALVAQFAGAGRASGQVVACGFDDIAGAVRRGRSTPPRPACRPRCRRCRPPRSARARWRWT